MNGITKFTNPMIANHFQSFENASIFIFLYKHKIKTGIAPKKDLKKPIPIIKGFQTYGCIYIFFSEKNEGKILEKKLNHSNIITKIFQNLFQKLH